MIYWLPISNDWEEHVGVLRTENERHNTMNCFEHGDGSRS